MFEILPTVNETEPAGSLLLGTRHRRAFQPAAAPGTGARLPSRRQGVNWAQGATRAGPPPGGREGTLERTVGAARASRRGGGGLGRASLGVARGAHSTRTAAKAARARATTEVADSAPDTCGRGGGGGARQGWHPRPRQGEVGAHDPGKARLAPTTPQSRSERAGTTPLPGQLPRTAGRGRMGRAGAALPCRPVDSRPA